MMCCLPICHYHCVSQIMSQTGICNHRVFVACGCCAMLCNDSLCCVFGTITTVDCLSKAKLHPAPAVLHPSYAAKLKPGSMPSMRSTYVLENIVFQADTTIHFQVGFCFDESQQRVSPLVFINICPPVGWPKLIICFFFFFFFFFFFSSSSFN